MTSKKLLFFTLVVSAFLLLAPAFVFAANPGEFCYGDSDCTTFGSSCVKSQCSQPQSPLPPGGSSLAPSSCSSNADCPSGYICDNPINTGGTCIVKQVSCSSNGDCPSGQICNNPFNTGGTCTPKEITCNTDKDCPAGQVCTNIINVKKICTAPTASPSAPPPAPTEKEVPFTPIVPNLQINIPTVQFSNITKNGQQLGIPFLAEYIAGVYKYAVAVVSIIAVVMIMVGGLRWMTAGGNASAISSAKEMISGAVIGLILLLGSYTVLYTINPDLVNFKALQVKLIQQQLVSYTQTISDEDYQKITGSPKLPKSEILKIAVEIGKKTGFTDPCYMITIVSKESGGVPGMVFHNENYQGKHCVKIRGRFLMSGKKYSGATFDPPLKSIDEYMADCQKYNTLPIFNDDGKKIDVTKPDYGLDWGPTSAPYNHDFGLMQVTRRGPTSDIPKLLSVEGNLQRGANIFKNAIECAKNKYPGGSEALLLRASFFAYGLGCGKLQQYNQPESDMLTNQQVRAMKFYNDCKSNNQQFSTSAPEPEPLGEDVEE